jgi:predicted porin
MLMKRSLFIAAVSTLAAGSALAQSSVTVYGRLNESVERQKRDDGTTTTTTTVLQNNASRIGFKGTEDLGGGLKAGFTLEHRFNADTGAATNTAFWGGAGESSVNLSGGFGMIKLGHYTSEAYFATSDATDLLNHGTGTSSDALYKYLNNDNNKISYRTPSIAGLTIDAALLVHEGTPPGGVAPGNHAYDLAVNYTLGNLGLGLGYEKSPIDDQQIAVRASYSIAPFTVTGYVQRFKNESIGKSKTIARVSGQYDIGALELHAALGVAGEIDGAGSAEDEGKAAQFTVGVNYNLSKRTKVFTFVNAVNTKAVDATLATKSSDISVGIRHNF